jgi:hypothetical protein
MEPLMYGVIGFFALIVMGLIAYGIFNAFENKKESSGSLAQTEQEKKELRKELRSEVSPSCEGKPCPLDESDPSENRINQVFNFIPPGSES